MNLFESIIYSFQAKMETPTPYGWFHIMCILLTLFSLVYLYFKRKNYGEKQLKTVLCTYGVIALILELIKQIMWAFNYDPVTQLVTWDYEWYAAPFQLCTTPIYVSLICLFLKKGKLRDSLLAYISYITILGSFMTIIIPDSCFTSYIEVNIHTMWLHCGSFVVSIYLLMNKEVGCNFKTLLNAFYVFLGFALFAEILNFSVYHSGILQGESFNMFYISPYFTSSLPVYDVIQNNVAFPIFLLFYIVSIFLGASLVYGITYLIKKLFCKK